MWRFLILFFITYHPIVSAQESALAFSAEQYVCYRANQAISTDGKLTEAIWAKVPWTADFGDIEGSTKPGPPFRTRAKMLWDDTYLYIAAELEEPDVWATFTERESPLHEENNFEVFIDPTGDTHNYLELQINAIGTIWDLFLTKPYRDGGIQINGWDIEGLKKGIHIEGKVNDASTKDKNWTVELALPWHILKDCAPGRRLPENGEQWRINMARAEWPVEVTQGNYVKKVHPQTGKVSPRFSTWSPQGAFAMHQPETWGLLQFSTRIAGTGQDAFVLSPDEKVKWMLRLLYYAQHKFKQQHGRFTSRLQELRYTNTPLEGYEFAPVIESTTSLFEITLKSTDGKSSWHIQQDGKVWKD